MATGTFNPDLNELFEEAFERATNGARELRTGYDFRTLRRSLNFLMADWSNRGINLWALESGTVDLVSGTATYNLPVDTVDLIEFMLREGVGQNQNDINVSRITVTDYATLPNKNVQGIPSQIFVERLQATPRFTLWPVPDTSSYKLYYWRLRRLGDGGNGTTTPDVPFRFLNALVSGLAYYLSQKVPEGAALVEGLKMKYAEDWQLAADEDRDRTTLRLVPGGMYG